jgi:hypothetical protein
MLSKVATELHYHSKTYVVFSNDLIRLNIDSKYEITENN